LRRDPSSAASVSFSSGKVFADEEAIETYRKLRIGSQNHPGKVFADEEAIETQSGKTLILPNSTGKVFADEEAIETMFRVEKRAGCLELGKYSLTKKRLRQDLCRSGKRPEIAWESIR